MPFKYKLSLHRGFHSTIPSFTNVLSSSPIFSPAVGFLIHLHRLDSETVQSIPSTGFYKSINILKCFIGPKNRLLKGDVLNWLQNPVSEFHATPHAYYSSFISLSQTQMAHKLTPILSLATIKALEAYPDCNSSLFNPFLII